MIYIILLALLVPFYIGLWKLFQKAGRKGWEAIVPLYNIIVLLKIVGRPLWWFIMLLVPVINLIFFAAVLSDLYRSFGRHSFGAHTLGILFFFIYTPYIAFSEKTAYLGPAGKGAPGTKVKKSTVREWTDAIIFAVFAATVIHGGLIQPFTIPTSSMEGTLLVGDYLFVSKFHYGVRTPRTPLQIPLTHNHIWGNENIPSYLDWIQLPPYRFPGLTEVKNNDVVVFNWPPDEFHGYKNHHPVDLKTNYIKRCVAIAGDTLDIKDRQVYINGNPAVNPKKMQFMYIVPVNSTINPKTFEKLEISEYELRVDLNAYIVFATPTSAKKLKEGGFVEDVILNKRAPEEYDKDVFPHSPQYAWNQDNMGPLYIPKKGATVEINRKTVPLYKDIIIKYDGNKGVKEAGGLLFDESGKQITKYTFKQNYYFMMGDNRHNSLDSRFWGFVPADHIVGKPLFTWISLDARKKFTKGKIRWSRMFRTIK